MRNVLVCLVGLWLSISVASAGVEVAYDDVDFSSFRTWAWGEGTAAAKPEVQQWIVEAIERELARVGLSKVDEGEADLKVVSFALSTVEGGVQGDYLHSVTWDVGVIRSGVVAETRGTLIVDLWAGDGDEPVWRGVATEAMLAPKPEKVHKKIDALVRKMFRQFPGER